MRGNVGEVQVQSIGPLANEQAVARQADARRGRVTQIGEEHAFPEGSAGHCFDVLHVEDSLWKALIKHAGLDFERNLRGLKAALELTQGGERARRKIDAVAESQQPGY